MKLPPLLLCLPCHAIVLTNGPDANVSGPAPGWDYTGDSGRWAVIAPRVAVGVAHVPPASFYYHGEYYGYTEVIQPVGVDLVFLVLNRDAPSYARVWSPTNDTVFLPRTYIIGGGVGSVSSTNWSWGANGWPPAGTWRKRWGYSDSTIILKPQAQFVWRSDQCVAGSQDSGGAVFTADGEYIGPIQYGGNPLVLGQYQSGGVLACQYLHLVQQWMPTNQPPKPRKPVNITLNHEQ